MASAMPQAFLMAIIGLYPNSVAMKERPLLYLYLTGVILVSLLCCRMQLPRVRRRQEARRGLSSEALTGLAGRGCMGRRHGQGVLVRERRRLEVWYRVQLALLPPEKTHPQLTSPSLCNVSWCERRQLGNRIDRSMGACSVTHHDSNIRYPSSLLWPHR